MSDKHDNRHSSNILLCDSEKVISDPKLVAEVFNEYYSSIASYKCTPDGLDDLPLEKIFDKHIGHQSIELIKNKMQISSTFDFQSVTPNDFHMYIKNMKPKKSYGFDGIQAKFIKLCGNQLSESLCFLFNECVKTSFFPTDMKLSEISPIFKKGDSLSKNNYRSVNLLPVASKIFERIISDQFTQYFMNILNSSLSAYRKGYSCQHVIINLTEYWRRALDKGRNVGTIAMD